MIHVIQVHAYIINHLKKEMPSMFGKDGKKKELIHGLADIFSAIQREHQISAGDFPDITRMKEQLQHHVDIHFLFSSYYNVAE